MRLDTERLPLQMRRLLLQIKQRDAAARIGCSQTLVSFIERGRIRADNDFAVAYLKLLREAERAQRG